jgi:hypothetical protein
MKALIMQKAKSFSSALQPPEQASALHNSRHFQQPNAK